MNEQPPFPPPENAPEKKIEKIPSKDEIRSVFERILDGKKYKEVRFKHDEHGVLLYEIETTEKGEKIEYNFQRASYDHTNPSLPRSAQASASIHRIEYDGDLPTAGSGCVANYFDGEWEFVE